MKRDPSISSPLNPNPNPNPTTLPDWLSCGGSDHFPHRRGTPQTAARPAWPCEAGVLGPTAELPKNPDHHEHNNGSDSTHRSSSGGVFQTQSSSPRLHAIARFKPSVQGTRYNSAGCPKVTGDQRLNAIGGTCLGSCIL